MRRIARIVRSESDLNDLGSDEDLLYDQSESVEHGSGWYAPFNERQVRAQSVAVAAPATPIRPHFDREYSTFMASCTSPMKKPMPTVERKTRDSEALPGPVVPTEKKTQKKRTLFAKPSDGDRPDRAAAAAASNEHEPLTMESIDEDQVDHSASFQLRSIPSTAHSLALLSERLVIDDPRRKQKTGPGIVNSESLKKSASQWNVPR